MYVRIKNHVKKSCVKVQLTCIFVKASVKEMLKCNPESYVNIINVLNSVDHNDCI